MMSNVTKWSVFQNPVTYIVMGTYCDCGSKFCRCYDVSDLYFVVVMTFMHSG